MDPLVAYDPIPSTGSTRVETTRSTRVRHVGSIIPAFSTYAVRASKDPVEEYADATQKPKQEGNVYIRRRGSEEDPEEEQQKQGQSSTSQQRRKSSPRRRKRLLSQMSSNTPPMTTSLQEPETLTAPQRSLIAGTQAYKQYSSENKKTHKRYLNLDI